MRFWRENKSVSMETDWSLEVTRRSSRLSQSRRESGKQTSRDEKNNFTFSFIIFSSEILFISNIFLQILDWQGMYWQFVSLHVRAPINKPVQSSSYYNMITFKQNLIRTAIFFTVWCFLLWSLCWGKTSGVLIYKRRQNKERQKWGIWGIILTVNNYIKLYIWGREKKCLILSYLQSYIWVQKQADF